MCLSIDVGRRLLTIMASSAALYSRCCRLGAMMSWYLHQFLCVSNYLLPGNFSKWLPVLASQEHKGEEV